MRNFFKLSIRPTLFCTAGVRSATVSKGVDTGCGINVARDSLLQFTGGTRCANVDVFDDTFPYLKISTAGSPNATSKLNIG